jgi:histone-lysine N-methyltransferase SETMAR
MAAPIQSPAKYEVHHIIPEVSKTTIHEAVTEKLGYRKLCARWVPKMLTDDHKTKRMGSALKFLTRYPQEGDEFLDSVVTEDETWVFHHTPESKQQSQQWRHTQAADFYDSGIQKLVPRLNKCLDNAGDYVKK